MGTRMVSRRSRRSTTTGSRPIVAAAETDTVSSTGTARRRCARCAPIARTRSSSTTDAGRDARHGQPTRALHFGGEHGARDRAVPVRSPAAVDDGAVRSPTSSTSAPATAFAPPRRPWRPGPPSRRPGCARVSRRSSPRSGGGAPVESEHLTAGRRVCRKINRSGSGAGNLRLPTRKRAGRRHPLDPIRQAATTGARPAA
jgi:hypothetical protein